MKKSSKAKEAKKRTPEEVVNQIQECCKLLGWNIAMDESSSGIKGLVIGQPDYVDQVVAQLEEGEAYSIYSTGEASPDIH